MAAAVLKRLSGSRAIALAAMADSSGGTPERTSCAGAGWLASTALVIWATESPL